MPPVLLRDEARGSGTAFAGRFVRLRGRRLAPALLFAMLLLPGRTDPGSPAPRIGRRTLDRFHGFPEMRGMLARFSLQLADAANARNWQSFSAGLRADDQLAQLRAVNAVVRPFPVFRTN